MPHQVFQWATAIFDRLLMLGILGAASTGIYSLAYQTSIVLGLVLTECNRAMMPTYARAGAVGQDRSIVEAAEQHVAVMILVSGAALLAVPVVAPYLFVHGYQAARLYVGPLMIGQLFFGLYFIPANIVTLTFGRTDRIWLSSATGTVLNIAGNLLLLRIWGVWGAVAATIVAYAVMGVMASWLKRSVATSNLALAGRWDLPRVAGLTGVTLASIAPLLHLALEFGAYFGCGTLLVLGPGRSLWSSRSSLRSRITPSAADPTFSTGESAPSGSASL